MYRPTCYNRQTCKVSRSNRGRNLGGGNGLGDISAIQFSLTSLANQYGIPPSIALAVAQIESGFNQSAVNAGGDTGVMQISPATAVTLGVDPKNLDQNLQGGVSYLAKLYQQFGDWGTALAAYNCGPGNPQGCTSYASKVLAAQPSYLSFDSAAPAAMDTGSLDSSLLASIDSGVSPLLVLGAVGLVAVVIALS